MFRNRITTMHDDIEPIRLPQPPAVTPNPGAFAFVAVPCACQQHSQMMQWLYQQAMEQAQAVARPSILERDLLGVWN